MVSDVTKKFAHSHSELAFLLVELHSVPPKDLEHFPQVVYMVFHLQTFDKHVIHVHFRSFPDLFGEHFVDQPLIGSSSVLESKGHHLVAIKAPINHKSFLDSIRFMHLDLIIAGIHVHETKEFKANGHVHDLVNAC